MKHCSEKRVLTTVILAALAQVAIKAEAAVTVTATPQNQTVPLGQSSSRSLVWNITDTCASTTSTVTSANGTFRDVCGSANILATSNSSLTSSKPVTFGVGNHSIPESVLVPADASFKAQKLGLQQFVYQRTFTGAMSSTGFGCLTLNITSSSAAGFNVSREALSFDNGAPVRVLERKQPLRANAEINYNGSGMLQAQWEIADPASSSGQPIFRSIATVRQYLVGSETQTISSPALPTEIAGLYLARLRITDPAASFDTPVIRYFVTDPQTGTVRPPVSLGLVTPPNKVLLTGDTTFAWDAIPGARAYQLEIYAKPRTAGDTLPDLGSSNAAAPVLPPTPPVTGMLIAGNQTRATLSDSVRVHLTSGQNYLWRVLAIGTDSNVIGESAVREVRMP